MFPTFMFLAFHGEEVVCALVCCAVVRVCVSLRGVLTWLVCVVFGSSLAAESQPARWSGPEAVTQGNLATLGNFCWKHLRLSICRPKPPG